MGNTKTSDHVIIRELRTIPGQKFSRADIIRTQMQLSQLGYFDAEKIGINPVPNQRDGTVDIEYTVTEKPSDQIQLSGGWGGFFGFVGTLGVTFNNFSAKKIFKFKEYDPLPGGDGQRFAMQFQANGRMFQMYSTSFTEPWLGGRKPHSLTVTLSHSVQNRIGANNTKLGGLQVTGISTFLSKRLKWPDDYFTLTHALSYNRYNLNNFTGFGFASTGVSAINFSNGFANNISFNNTLSRNSLDKPMYPRSGSSISLSLTTTPPYSLFNNINYQDKSLPDSVRFKFIEFHKWMFDGSWFFKVAGNLVLNSRIHFGYIGSYRPSTGIGPFERFFMGGSGLTGFNFLLAYDIIGLRGYRDNQFAGDKGIGGIGFTKYVMELRYPISLNPMATVWAHTFLEAGNNWDKHRQFNPFYVNRAGGVGARFFLAAMGALIGVDYGIGFDSPLINDPSKSSFGNFISSKGRFTFTIGQQIR
jgi:outer membrane protein insertion porin family